MTAPVIDVDGLRKVFPSRRRGPTIAVDTVSFAVGENEIVGLLGANGAGKTTTIKCLAGLGPPTAGRINVAGVDVPAHPRRAATKVAVVLEGNRNLYWRLNPRENIDFFAGLQGIDRGSVTRLREQLLERFGLTDKATTPARMLSRGMQQKLSLACALARQTRVLLLDEPTLGLDVEISHELRGYIRELATAGHTILLSSHDMSVVQDVCDRVVVLKDGRVVADDKVANLLSLFRAQAYRFRIDGGLPAEACAALDSRFPVLSIAREDGATTIDVEFNDGRGFYDLVDVLKATDAVLTSVAQQEVDLEQVFLRLVARSEP